MMRKIKMVMALLAITLLMASSSYADQCLICHPGGPVERNCLASGCHDTYNNGNHHTTAEALDGMCTACHDPSLVADYDEGNPSQSSPTNLTPTVQSCNNCHKGHASPVDQNGDPYPFPIQNTAVLEHMDGQGYTTNCLLCHPVDPPNDPAPIKQCETCHTVEILHNIAGHAVVSPDPLPYDGYWYDENGDWMLISENERCLACHSDGVDPAPDTMSYVSQDVGTYDTPYSELDEGYCRGCHGASTADRHHQLLVPPVIDKIRPRPCPPGETIRILGSGFGDGSGNSAVHIGPKTYYSDNPRIKLWTHTKIKVKIPFENKECDWFIHGDGEYRKRKVWVTVDQVGNLVDSNKKILRVAKPHTCGEQSGCSACH